MHLVCTLLIIIFELLSVVPFLRLPNRIVSGISQFRVCEQDKNRNAPLLSKNLKKEYTPEKRDWHEYW